MNPAAFYRGDGLRARLAVLLDISRAVLRVAAPVVDLVVRLSLAKAFFAPGMLPGSDVGDFRTAWPMILAQVMGPVLLATGFLVRPVALLMLVLTLLAQSLGAPQDEHLFWAALFGWYVVQGAGPLSLDRVLAKGLGQSPLPLAGPAMTALRWVTREVGPLYLLGLRLWLAAALAAPSVNHRHGVVEEICNIDLATVWSHRHASGIITSWNCGDHCIGLCVNDRHGVGALVGDVGVLREALRAAEKTDKAKGRDHA